MPVKRLGFAHSLTSEHTSKMLDAQLIVVADQTSRRFGDATVTGVARGHQIRRDQGVAVIISAVHKWAEAAVQDHNRVPDPVVFVVTLGEPSPGLVKACKDRGAELITLRPGYAAVAVATNEMQAQGSALTVLDSGEAPKSDRVKMPKRPKKKTPAAAPVSPVEPEA